MRGQQKPYYENACVSTALLSKNQATVEQIPLIMRNNDTVHCTLMQ